MRRFERFRRWRSLGAGALAVFAAWACLNPETDDFPTYAAGDGAGGSGSFIPAEECGSHPALAGCSPVAAGGNANQGAAGAPSAAGGSSNVAGSAGMSGAAGAPGVAPPDAGSSDAGAPDAGTVSDGG